MLYKVVYYVRPNGKSPVAEWRDEQQRAIKADISAKLVKLAQNGLILLNTKVLDNISGIDNDLYELRGVTLKWRIAVYFDRSISTFVLLYGWRKQQRVQERDIERARRFLREYLSGVLNYD
jgi:hypothetical protein